MINRRQLLAFGGAAAAAGVGLGLAGCAPEGGAGNGDGGAPSGKGFTKPTYKAYTGLPATKPALDNGTGPYFDALPKEFPASTTGVPGKGGPVVCHTFLNSTPAAVDKNKWWQAINEATGVDLQLQGAAIGDYPSKFQTVVAGGDLPDLMAVLPDSTPELAKLLKAKAQDLTDFLAGDAILDYPNLANIPQYTWDACTYNGRIYTLPIHRFALTHGYGLRTDIAEQRNAPTKPKSGDEFYQLMKNLSNKKEKWFATNNVVWLVEIVAEMMGIANDWGESGGNFTKDVEDERYPEVLNFVKKCWDEELIHPSCWEANFSLQSQALFNSGDAPLILGGLTWVGNGSNARQQEDPNAQTDSWQMYKWDGSGPADRYVGGGAPYQTMMKTASEDRVKELLGVVNWLAGPWGTKEWMLFRSGVEGVHYTRDADGKIVSNADQAKADNMGPLIYMGSGPQVHYNSYADLALKEYEHEAQAMDVPLYSAALGLESPTGQTKNAQLNKLLTDARADIITGRKDISSWATTLSDWKSKGGDKVRQELQEAKQAKG